MSLKNRSIIIPGAAIGLGLAEAKELAAQGANCALVDFNEKSLSEAQKAQSLCARHRF